MKKLPLLMAGLIAASAAYADEISTPTFYSEDFVEMSNNGDYLTPEWVTYGNGVKPVEDLTIYFNAEGKGPYYILLDTGGSLVGPMSTTSFDPSTKADQWLITPEIEVTEDNCMVGFTTFCYSARGKWGKNAIPYKVLVADNGGTAKEDFKDEILSASITPSTQQNTNSRNVYASMAGYKGKKVRLAFVNEGQDGGNIGFTNISLGAYAARIENKTVAMGETGDDCSVQVNIGLKAPITCPGFTTTLEFGDKKYEIYTKKNLYTPQSNGISYQLVKFDAKDYLIKLGAESVPYTVTITPDYEGAPSSVLKSQIAVSKFKYPNNVVMEEPTGTPCQFCPIGIAAINYYHDTFPGSDTEGRVIAIALHDNQTGADPMNVGIEAYDQKVISAAALSGLPAATYNRATKTTAPWSISSVERLIAAPSNYQAQMESVVADENATVGSEATANFTVRAGYDASNLELNAAVVVVENDVQGDNSEYNQKNAFYNRGSDYINQYDKRLAPYMTDFLMGGSLGDQTIRFDKIKYQHVARGIFPAFEGEPLSKVWQADEAQTYSISFNIPDNVMIWKNCEVIILITDNSGEIVASDNMNVFSGAVGEISSDSDNINIICDGGMLNVTAQDGSIVEIYTADGILNGRHTVEAGQLTVDCSALNGVGIVKVANATSAKTAKVIF